MTTLARLGFALVLTLALALIAAAAAHAQSDIILDNGSAAFSTIGTWPSSTSTPGYYGPNYQTHDANGAPPAGLVVDNSDAGFSASGTWPLSTSIPGYLGANYQVHAANGAPPTALAADNSDGTVVGTWPVSTSVGGFYGTNYQTHSAGGGANSFTWTLNVATAGTYEVYARWTAYPNRATNAKYSIAHAGGTDLVTVNQQANTATWQLLGTYTFDAGAATVTLSDDANGYVIADAVMLQPPGAAPNTATWSLAVASAGTYNVYARWTAYPNRATNAQFTVNSASGPATVTVNQQDGAGGQWNLLGTYSFNAGTATVGLTDQADGYVIADAVMLLPPGAPPNSAIWTPNVAQAGQYQVYAWWAAGSNRATNATYTVANAQGSTPVAVNQQANGGAWNLLGTFALAPGTTDTITLTDQANGYVIADAIRLVPVQTQAQMQLYYVEVDQLNTPRLVADVTGTTVWRWDQAEPFGDSVPNEDPDGDAVAFSFPMRFPGQYADKETGLLQNGRRDYNPPIGGYIQGDPLGIATT
ncbi:MAG: RHS repeat-associated core domain-containing protein, partial [Gemmatimonadales bacterium]